MRVAVLELVTTQHQPCVTLQTTPRTPKNEGKERGPSSPGRDPEHDVPQLHDVNLPILDAKHLTHHLLEFLGLTVGRQMVPQLLFARRRRTKLLTNNVTLCSRPE